MKTSGTRPALRTASAIGNAEQRPRGPEIVANARWVDEVCDLLERDLVSGER
jgi:hypothetical protein